MRGRILDLEPVVDEKKNAVGFTFNACLGEDSLVRGPFYYGVVQSGDVSSLSSAELQLALNNVQNQLSEFCGSKTSAEILKELGEEVTL